MTSVSDSEPRSPIVENARLDKDGYNFWENTERELDERAEWKRMQQNTFTNWVNKKLQVINESITDLEHDLSDGIVLIKLVQVLSQKRVPGRYTVNVQFRSQQFENVSMALKFLEDDENIRIVNIDSSDIVDHRLKLILGLIWTLILHYDIAMPIWDDQLNISNGGSAYPVPKPDKETPKERLLNWVSLKLPPELKVKNFTSDWNDGIALGALVDSVAPGLNPDWVDWHPQNKLQNATQAMDLAEQWLDVPKLVKPEEVISANVDEQSMMTYLSQYPPAKPKAGAPRRKRVPQQQLNRPSDEMVATPVMTSAPELPYSKIDSSPVKRDNEPQMFATPPLTPYDKSQSQMIGRAYGQGIQSRGSVQVGKVTQFVVELQGGGNGRGQLDVEVVHKSGRRITCDSTFEPSTRTYTVSYLTEVEGSHQVHVRLNSRHVEGSPFNVDVSRAPVDVSKVRCSGPGLEPGVLQNQWTAFNVELAGSGATPDDIKVAILSPDQSRTIEPTIKETASGVRIEYCSQFEGLHSINVFCASKPVTGSPYGVRIKPASEPGRVKAWGRGLQENGCRIGDTTCSFTVNTQDAGSGILEVNITAPGWFILKWMESNGRPMRLLEEKKDEHTTIYSYVPVTIGTHKITILFAGQHINKSPFEVFIAAQSDSPVRAFGPGLESGIARLPADFTVETNGDTSPLGASATTVMKNSEETGLVRHRKVEVHEIEQETVGVAVVAEKKTVESMVQKAEFGVESQPQEKQSSRDLVGNEVTTETDYRLLLIAGSLALLFLVILFLFCKRDENDDTGDVEKQEF